MFSNLSDNRPNQNKGKEIKKAACFLVSLVFFFFLVQVFAYSLTLASITIDGNFADWQPVLSNPGNVIEDTVGSNDPDYYDTTRSPGSFTSDRDMVRMAFTWDSTNLYFYFRRTADANREINWLIYLDRNNDGIFTSADRIIRYKFNGITYNGGWVYVYNPSNPSGDPIYGDGWDQPGSAGSEVAGVSLLGAGGGNGNLEYECRISWSSLGLSPGSPVRFHPASSLGANLPVQVQDNGNPGSNLLAGVQIFPDNIGSASSNSIITYIHQVKNIGNTTDTIDLTAASSRGWLVGIYEASGVTTVSSVTLAPGANTTITVKITIPQGIPNGTTDITTIRGTSRVDPTKTDTAKKTTTVVGSVAITPDNSGSMTTGTAISYSHQVFNNTNTTDTFTLSASSSQGWFVVFKDGSGQTTITSVTVGPNSSVNIIAQISVPATATVGSQDVATVRATSTNNPSNYGEAVDITTVKKRVLIDPDNERATGPGTFINYIHTVISSWNATDTIDLTATSRLGWVVRIYDRTGVNQISSVKLGPNGDSTEVVVRITVPSEVSSGTIDVTTVTARSFSNPNYYDIAVNRTTVQVLLTYKDAARAYPSTFFRLGDTIYAGASGLTAGTNVYFVWYDASATLVRQSFPSEVDTAGKSYDHYYSSGTETPGQWTLVLRDAANHQEIARTYFTVSYKAEITALIASDAPNLNQTIYVDTTLTNSSVTTITGSFLTYVIWWDENGSGTFDAGDIYIGSDGNPYTWDGTSTVFTKQTTGVTVGPNGGVWSEPGSGWSVSNFNFPYRGTYRVTCTWRYSAGWLIDRKTSTFYSVPALGWTLFILFSLGAVYFIFRISPWAKNNFLTKVLK